jgi:hypothetical protein
MPQKTKKQKMAAEKRKSQSFQSSPHIVKEEKNSQLNHTQIQQNSSVLVSNASTSAFKKELYKSLIISAAIIVVEIVIYLAQNR